MTNQFQQQLAEALDECFPNSPTWKQAKQEAQARINALLEEAMPEPGRFREAEDELDKGVEIGYRAAFAEMKQSLGLEEK